MTKTRKKKTATPRHEPSVKPRKLDTPPDRAALILAGLGLLITAYLTVVAWTRVDAAFCTAGSGCDVIQQSEWSTLLGLPMALWGFGVYALIAFVAAYRPTTALRRWRWLWRLALLGVAISLYLTVVGVLVLKAVCIWCLLSLVVLCSLFVLLNLRRPESAPGHGTSWLNWLLGHGLPVLLLIGLLHVHLGGLLTQRPENPRVAALVTHLERTGAKYYGASWCVNCRQQTRLFGVSAARLPYVECSPAGQGGPVAPACLDAGITAYPTWVIRGQRYTQVLPLEEVAAVSGFDWAGYESK